MIVATGKCQDCGKEFDVTKDSIMEGWSDIICPPCPRCESRGTFVKVGGAKTDMAKGKCGNSESGYGSAISGKKSTKFGNYKGTHEVKI